MSSILSVLNFGGDNDLNLVIIVPVFALVVAVAFLLKFSLRKPEVNKKTQKVKEAQAHNKEREEKVNGEKREKVVKEKKASSSPTKSLDNQTVNEATKSSKKQQQQPKQQGTINEKPSKKSNAQNKKQQVNNTNTNNALAKANKKHVDIFINKEEEGEWQTVTTKKQKQNKQENVVAATTSVKTTLKPQKSPEKANKQPSNKTKKAKEVTEKSDNSTKIVNGEVSTVEEIIALTLEPKKIINKSTENSVLPSEITKVTNQNDNVDSGLNSTTSIAATNVEIKTSTARDINPVANVAFDELGDNGWTDTKPQKKNRRKALRE